MTRNDSKTDNQTALKLDVPREEVTRLKTAIRGNDTFFALKDCNLVEHYYRLSEVRYIKLRELTL